jgi:hypothetical protein
MAKPQEDYLAAYLFASGTTDSTLSYAQSLAKKRKSGVHFVFPLVGAWDSMTVLEAAPGDLRAIRRLVTDLTDGRGKGDRMHHFWVVAIPLTMGRIKKLEPPFPIEALVAIRTQAGAAQRVFDELESELRPPGVGILSERVNGSYDLVSELWAEEFEPMQNALGQLRAAVGDRGAVDVSYASL